MGDRKPKTLWHNGTRYDLDPKTGQYLNLNIKKQASQRAYRVSRPRGPSLGKRLTRAWHNINSPRTVPIGSRGILVATVFTGFLLFLLVGTALYHPSVQAAQFNGFGNGHTRTQIYSTPSSFGSGTGAILNDWTFNSTILSQQSQPVCIGLQSPTQLRFKYDTGKTATSFGPYQFAATDIGNMIDLQQQPKMGFANGRWWVFYANSTGANGNKIIHTSSVMGTNATGSWKAGGTFAAVSGAGQFAGQQYSVTSYFANAAGFSTWFNSTHVFLAHTSSTADGNSLRLVVGLLNSDGTITWGADNTIKTAGPNARFDFPFVFAFGASANFKVLVFYRDQDTPLALVNKAHSAYSTNIAYTAWTNNTLHSALGAETANTAWYGTIADMNNGTAIIAYSSSNGNYNGVQGFYDTQFTPPSTYSAEVTGASSNNVAWFPYSLAAKTPGRIIAQFVNGTGSNLNQVFLVNERDPTGWDTSYTATGVPTGRDLSSGGIWDATYQQYYFVNQLTDKSGISGWWSSTSTTNTNGYTNTAVNYQTNSNMTTFFKMVSPTDGNVSSRYNRMNQALFPVTISDGTYRTGTFWTEGNGAAPTDATAYRLVFGSILMPHGKPQYGNNCNSASVAILKSPINFQAVSGRQLELFFSWDCQGDLTAKGCLKYNPAYSGIDIALRTNGTLPSFTEGWLPENDPAVRAIFRYDMTNAGVFRLMAIVAKDPVKSITEEGIDTDTVICVQDNAALCPPLGPASSGYSCPAGFMKLFGQVVLNFTGPRNEVNLSQVCGDGSTGFSTPGTASTRTLASGFQQGINYYLVVKVNWDFGLVPQANQVVDFRTGDTFGGYPIGSRGNLTPTTSSFYSVPAGCSDEEAGNNGLAACGARPLFGLNPLDPSSWANAIVKGIVWGFTEALKVAISGAGVVTGIFIAGLNALGGFFGLGQLGNAIVSVFTGVATWISNVLGGTAAQAVALGTFVGNLITAIVNGVGNFWTGATAFFSEAASLFSQFWTAVNTVFRFQLLGIKWLVMVDLLWGIMGSFASLAQFRYWLWFNMNIGLGLFRLLFWIGEKALDLIAKIRTVAPRPFGI